MKTVKGYHGEWNMGSPGGWEYQRIAQLLGKRAWALVEDAGEVGVDLDFDHPQINAVPGFARMILRAHENTHGRNGVHAVLLAESGTLDVVLENKNFVNYLNTIEGIRASLAEPGHLSLKRGKVCCRGGEVTVMFMDFNSNTLLKMAEQEDITPILEAITQGIVVNPRGMEPLGVKGIFEAITEEYRDTMSRSTVAHTPWTRRFYARSTTGPGGEPIDDVVEWARRHWEGVILKPAYGYSGHGIYVGYKLKEKERYLRDALDSGEYIIQELIPLALWSEESPWPVEEEQRLSIQEWQTDFRCFITDEGLQGFLARFGGVPTNVGSGGGIQPLAVLKDGVSPRGAVDKINKALLRLGYQGYIQIQEEINREAIEMGFTYLLGPIKIMLRPRLLTVDHLRDLRRYAAHLWRDAVKLEEFWREGHLDHVVRVGDDERQLALNQPWSGSPALMVSDGLFSLGVDLINRGVGNDQGKSRLVEDPF
jgi:hypothetical protein